MSKEVRTKEKPNNHHDEVNLKGTFLMVMSLGALMVISWFGAFMLFMERM